MAGDATSQDVFHDMPALGNRVRTAQTQAKTLKAAVTNVLKGGSLSLVQTRRLLFIQLLGTVTGWDDGLVTYLVWEQTETSLSQVALEHYHSDSLPPLKADTLARFRANLWEREPLAVLLSSLQAEKLLKTHMAELRRPVAWALQICIEKNLQVISPEFKDLLLQQVLKTGGNQTQFDKLLDLLKAIQRLHCVVTDPTHVDILLKKGMRSAHDIAVLSRPVFISVMAEDNDSSKVSEDAAIRIHDLATSIDCRNQETWISLLDSIKKDFVAINPLVSKDESQKDTLKPDEKSVAQPSAAKTSALAQAKYNMTEIFDLQISPCEECCSVTSASAYFVDLLNFLRASICDTKPIVHKTALDALTSRRPDLLTLELSCANSKNMLPYIAIVNEILELYIAKQENLEHDIALARINEKTEDTAAGIRSLQSTQLTTVFQDSISGQMFPLTTFPYNQGIDAIQTYLDSVGLSVSEVISTFQSEGSIVAQFQGALPPDDSTARASIIEEATKVWKRASVAASLGLQPMDMAAVTKETVYTTEFLGMMIAMKATPSKGRTLLDALKVPQAHTNWGYSSVDSMLSTDETAGTGLCFIRSEFLPRSGLSFEELLELVNTLYFCRRLVITNPSKSREFTGQLSEMRLASLNVYAEPPKESAVGPLTEQLCHELQAFIRLKNRLGWSMAELDAVLAALTENQVANSVTNNPQSARGISYRILEDMATVMQISSMTDTPVASLLPFWSTISTRGKGSVYEKFFLGPAATLCGDAVFKADSTGAVLKSAGLMSDHIPALMAALKCSQDGLKQLVRAAGYSSIREPLTMQSISKLYRHATMAKLLKASLSEYLEILSVLSPSLDLFQDPQSTLRYLEQWQQLLDSDWSAKQIISTIRGDTEDQSIETNAVALSLTAQLAEKLESVNDLWNPRVEQATVTSQDVLDACAQLFDSDAAKSVAALVEGTQTTSATMPLEPSGTKLLSMEMPPNISLSVTPLKKDGNVTITLEGILPAVFREEILKNTADIPDLKATIHDLNTRSLEGLNALSARLTERLDEKQSKELISQMSVDVREGLKGLESDEAAITKEKTLQKRRTLLVKSALPTIRADLVRESLIRCVGDKVPELDSAILHMLITTPLVPGKTEEKTDPLGALEKVVVVRSDTDKLLSGFYSPDATDSYQFWFSSKVKPAFSINGIPMPLVEDDRGWHSSAVMMTSGQSYVLSSTMSLNDIRWTVKRSSPAQFTRKTLVAADTVATIDGILQPLFQSAYLIKQFGLGLEEFKYFMTPKALLQIRLDKMDVSDLCALQNYQSLRDSISKDAHSLVGLLGWLKNPTTETLAARLFAATIWSQDQLETIISLKYPGLKAAEIISRFHDIKELASLRDIIAASRRLGTAPGRRLVQPLEVLFRVATPTPPGRETDDFQNASTLQLCLGDGQLAQCTGKIRETQRTVLVQYLLQQSYVKDLGIFSADGLFAHFMLDVQMGAQLEITRMKAAISTVQLFVQRCLLGREADNGVLSRNIDQGKWAWMQRHNLWQATRRAFLYPENYLDATLRDDKTPLYDDFETAIMSKDLNWDTFAKAIRSYVQSLSGISDLDIQAYLREYRQGAWDKYHFFGRTRTAPFEFYYRCMLRPATDVVLWSPWKKIDVDVMTYEADWDGSSIPNGGSYLVPVIRNNRLFLYLPQILVKTPASSTDSADYHALAKTKPGATGPRVWEIRMAWTELVDGQWTPKRVSQSYITVGWMADPGSGSPGLPPLSSFIFDAETKGGPNVTIRVSYWRKNDSKLCAVGQFDINDERVGTITDPNQTTTLGTALCTTFHKHTWGKAAADPDTTEKGVIKTPSVSAYSNGKEGAPLLAIPKRKYERTLTWTVSFADDDLRDVTGLVADEQVGSGAEGSTYFLYPREMSLDETVGSSTLYLKSAEELIEHPYSRSFMEDICKDDGLSKLFQTMGSKLAAKEDYGKTLVKAEVSNYHELSTSYALYNWELGMHTILLAVERFQATQQLELALRAARLIFDPTTTPAEGEDPATACWRFAPFRDIASSKYKVADRFKGWPSDSTFDAAVTERRSNPSSAHSTARGRPQAYMKWVVMKYIEILITLGDEYFRQGSMETLPLAIQRYVEAAHVLGPDPPKLPKLGKPKTRTFQTIGSVGDPVPMELLFPFLCNVERRGSPKAPDDQRSRSALLCLLQTTYFCLPPNPKYASLRALVQDRLYKTRNNLDIHGRPIVYSMAEPYIDPGDMARALSGGGAGAIASLMNDADSPMPYYRFSALIGKALELCSDLRSMGEQFLAAKEKRDVEALALLKARQDSALQKMQVELRTLQRDEIHKNIESLRQNRDATVLRLKYYLKLIGESEERIPDTESKEWEDISQNIDAPTSDDLRMSPHEQREMISAQVATGLNVAASGMETVIGMLRAVPNVTTNMQPMGCGVSIKADAGNMAELTQGILMSLKMASMIASEVSATAARTGALTKQLQERRMEANARGREIKNIDKQIEIQKKRLEINAKEADIQRRELENAIETETWYKAKYTNEKLYAWMENSTRALHFDLYTLAADLCRRAERAFRYEKGPASVRYLRSGGYWDSSRDGLLAAQQLSLDLRRMEVAYLEKPSHDFELTKNISLRQLDPLALLALREYGTTTFSLPELVYDMDFPGHYMRRIKSVGLSIPCIISPYTALAATLSITRHAYRVSTATTSPEAYAAVSAANDGSFRTDPVPITAVATSSGMQDAGTFELGFSQLGAEGRFAPFEGAGAISSWKLELPPPAMRQFDYESISDVVLHVRYTAVDGGPLLKSAATGAVAAMRARLDDLGAHDGLWRYVEARHELSNEWASFRAALARKAVDRTATLDLRGLSARLPSWAHTPGRSISVESLTVVIKGADDTIAQDLAVPALGVADWDETTLGGKTLLSKKALSPAVLLNEDAAWKLTVTKAAGQACGVEDISILFRYILVDAPLKKKKR